MGKLVKHINHRFKWAYNILRTGGVKSLVLAFSNFLYLKRKCYILTYDLSQTIEPPDLSENIVIINSDMKILNDVRKSHLNLPVEFFFDQIDGCRKFYLLLVRIDNTLEPGAICWAYDHNQINKVISLSADEIESKHGITMEKFRGMKLFTILTRYMLSDFKSNGYSRIVNLIEEHNHISLKLHKKQGFIIVDEWIYRKILGFRISKKFSTSKNQLEKVKIS